MKPALLVAVYLGIHSIPYAQEQENIIATLEQHAEIATEKTATEKADDSFIFQLENYKKHPVNLNKANADDLRNLIGLSDLQIENFLKYRALFGDLVDIHELQAVPGWNVTLIQLLLPFITIAENAGFADRIKERWNNGTHSFLLRSSTILEKSAGYHRASDSGNYFMGSAASLTVRYNYNYRNLLQWGFSGDKDAGEQLFKGSQKAGFDFYSFHFFLSRLGIIKSLAIGDFTINMGQGLIQWQNLAFSKSPEISSVKRQSAALRPYTATGESNSHRGLGTTLQKGRWETTLFASIIKRSGNLVKDSVNDTGHVSSILSSGYHRTSGELADRNNLQQATAGMIVKYAAENWHLAFNAIKYRFSLPLKKDDRPYNYYTSSGTSFSNESIDYSFTYKNVHFFGELAVDRSYHAALVSGLLASLSTVVDLSLVYRSIDKRYQSFNADAFTENSEPVNERGLYAGISIRPTETFKVNVYCDHYYFPWLKYRVDAPSPGSEYFIQLICNPNKQVELYTQFRSELKQQNVSNGGISNYPANITKQNWRIHADIKINRMTSLRSRVEMVVYNKKQQNEEQGFLMLQDVLYKPASLPLSGNVRLEYFETNGYNSRLYAFENDLMYSFSVPAIFDKGFRYYLNFNYDVSKFTKRVISKKISAECWIKYSQTIYNNKEKISSGLDEISGNKKTELKFQVIIYR